MAIKVTTMLMDGYGNVIADFYEQADVFEIKTGMLYVQKRVGAGWSDLAVYAPGEWRCAKVEPTAT